MRVCWWWVVARSRLSSRHWARHHPNISLFLVTFLSCLLWSGNNVLLKWQIITFATITCSDWWRVTDASLCKGNESRECKHLASSLTPLSGILLWFINLEETELVTKLTSSWPRCESVTHPGLPWGDNTHDTWHPRPRNSPRSQATPWQLP